MMLLASNITLPPDFEQATNKYMEKQTTQKRSALSKYFGDHCLLSLPISYFSLHSLAHGCYSAGMVIQYNCFCIILVFLPIFMWLLHEHKTFCITCHKELFHPKHKAIFTTPLLRLNLCQADTTTKGTQHHHVCVSRQQMLIRVS